MKRRALLTLGAATLAGCAPPRTIDGGFTGVAVERGHRLRAPPVWPAPSVTRRVRVVVAGGGVAGLAAARALRLQGVDDLAVLELEDSAGGNSRGGTVAGIACPLGAHYLPLPGSHATAVQDLLEELGLRRRVAGRWTYDERHLCHSPQERLFLPGPDGWQWQDGLLPLHGVGADTLAQYRRFADAVAAAHAASPFAMPVPPGPLSPAHAALDALSFQAWLDSQGLTDAHLRWYLGYCCRDDYGAGIAQVSAWAGLHYFASRHGFQAPGQEPPHGDSDNGLLTWPEGNGWLTRRLAAPLGGRLCTGQLVVAITPGRHGVAVDALDTASGALTRWQAERCVVALPAFVAARVVRPAPPALLQAAAAIPHAPWLVANLHIATALHDRPGAPPSWDNVVYGTAGLGYVDAMHQSLLPVPGATVLTCYRALGDLADGRQQLFSRPWAAWRDAILAELASPHPDLLAKATRMDITRYGHAMAIPRPGLRSHPALLALLRHAPGDRLLFAHSDLAAYSVFEEAFTLGHRAGLAASGRPPGA